jgi:hypothetical protein
MFAMLTERARNLQTESGLGLPRHDPVSLNASESIDEMGVPGGCTLVPSIAGEC